MTIRSEILKKYNIEDINQHQTNTLDFVGVALNFVYPNIGDIEQAFYNKIFSEYPERVVSPMKEHKLQISNEGLNKNKVSIEERNSVNFIYSDEEGKYQLLLNSEMLDFQCLNPRKNYSNFKDFSKNFKQIYSCLIHVAGAFNTDIAVNKKALFVRKINRVNYDSETLQKLNKDYIKELDLLQDNGISAKDHSNFYNEIISQEEDGTKIVIRNGSSLSLDGKSKSLMYDFQVFKDNPSKLYSNMETDLDNFSTIIYNLYRHMLGDKFFE